MALEMPTGMQRLICGAKMRSHEDTVLPCGPQYHIIASPCCWNLTTSNEAFAKCTVSEGVVET